MRCRLLLALGLWAATTLLLAAGARAEPPDSSATPVPAGAPAPPIAWTPRLLVQTDAVVGHHGPTTPPIEDGTAHPGLYVRRARLGADAASGWWRGRVIVEATARPEVAAGRVDAIAGELGGGAPRAPEAFIAFVPGKGFALSAGSMRVPLGLSRQIDEGDLTLPERARIITRATPDFRVGAAATGDLGLLQYALGTYAAAPTLGADFATGGDLTVVRLAGEPIGPMGVAPHLRPHDDPWYPWWRFSAGVSAFYATLPGANEFGVGGDGQLQWLRFNFAGEVLWTRRAAADRVGFTLEPGVFVWRDRLELVARAEWFNDEVGPETITDAWGASLGATFFSLAGHARLQAAYTVRAVPAAGAPPPSGWATLRATFKL